jgi:ribosomal protein S20
MPIIKSAKKAARQTIKRTANNVQIKKNIRLALKDFKKSPTATSASKIQSEYDKAVKKGLLKKNTASRRKASLAKIAKAANVKPVATTPKKPAATPAKKTVVPATKPTATKKAAPKKPATAKKPAAKKPAATTKTKKAA